MTKFSQHPKYSMSAILIKGGSVLSVGTNKVAAPKRFIRPYRKNLALHAEIDAILGLDKSKTKGATAYIAGKTKNGHNILTKPCPSCMIGLNQMGIKRIVYMDREGKLHEFR